MYALLVVASHVDELPDVPGRLHEHVAWHLDEHVAYHLETHVPSGHGTPPVVFGRTDWCLHFGLELLPYIVAS